MLPHAHAKIQNSKTRFSRIYLKLADFLPKIGLIGRVLGVSEIFFQLESSYLYYLGAHAKIQNSMTSLSRIY